MRSCCLRNTATDGELVSIFSLFCRDSRANHAARSLLHTWLAGEGLVASVKHIRDQWAKPSSGVCPNCHEDYIYSATPTEQRMPQRGAGDIEAQPLYRDASFDADAAIRPAANETGSPKM
jgi:hypothetical protein